MNYTVIDDECIIISFGSHAELSVKGNVLQQRCITLDKRGRRSASTGPRGPPQLRETCTRTSHTIGARIIAPRGHTGTKRPFTFRIESSHPKEDFPPFRTPNSLVRRCLDTLDDTGGLVPADIENRQGWVNIVRYRKISISASLCLARTVAPSLLATTDTFSFYTY